MTSGPVTVERLGLSSAEPRMASAAGSLLARGLRPGDRVAFSLPTSGDLLCAILGAARVGITPVTLNSNLTSIERDLLLDDAQAAHAVLDTLALTELVRGPMAEIAEYPLTRPMVFTSGTTGHPKGVSAGVWDERTSKEVFDDEAAVWGFGAEDVHLVNSPLHHSVSIRFAVGTLLSGGTLILPSRFDAGSVLEILRNDRPTTTFMVPTHLQRLFAHPALGTEERFDSLRLLAHAGAPCPTSTKLEAIRRVPSGALWEFYGSTEGQFTVCSTQEWIEHPGTVGRARPGRRLFLRTIEDDDEDGGDEGVGEIWCEVPESARFSYFGDPPATEAAWSGNAFSVGDLGRLDSDGYLYLSGRRTELIITGGVNVYPVEIEEALVTLSGVEQACVFGVDDETWGQKVCAAVVAGSPLTLESLHRDAETVLAPFKRPKEVFFVDELPVGPTGKVLRKDLPRHVGLV